MADPQVPPIEDLSPFFQKHFITKGGQINQLDDQPLRMSDGTEEVPDDLKLDLSDNVRLLARLKSLKDREKIAITDYRDLYLQYLFFEQDSRDGGEVNTYRWTDVKADLDKASILSPRIPPDVVRSLGDWINARP
ncbi:hypothetical protein MMC13_003090, partial [Lambiella insularis]|nr:hypothetical protein [Lambiella insularis]